MKKEEKQRLKEEMQEERQKARQQVLDERARMYNQLGARMRLSPTLTICLIRITEKGIESQADSRHG